MALVELQWKPDDKTLREFSEFWMFFLGMVGAPLALFEIGWFAYGGRPLAITLWVLAVAGRLIGAFRPQWMRPVFVGMSLLALPIGWTVSHLALALIYFGVFTPVAIVFRIIGRDALNRKIDKSAKTYWEAYNPNQGKKRYLRQF